MSAVSGAGNLSQLAFELILQPSLLEPKVLAPNRGETKDKLPRGVPDEVPKHVTPNSFQDSIKLG